MRPLRYSINVTLDGCIDHTQGYTDEEMHAYSTAIIGRADALIFGRVTYEMMEAGFRSVGETGVKPAPAPPNVTEVAPARFVPAIVTSVPAPPEDGANDEIAGCAGGGVAGTSKW